MKNTELKLDKVAALYAPLKPYIENVIPLMLKHTWILKNKFDNDAEYQLRQSLWVCRLITLDSRIIDFEKEDRIEGWESLRGKIIKQINNCTSSNNLERMTNNIMNLLNPILHKNYIDGYCIPPREFRSWWYSIHEQETMVAVHIINSYQPESPFSHLKSFSGNLLRAVLDAMNTNERITTVQCGSWLNQYPKFQRMWPNSFLENQKLLNKTGGLGPGAWGQYMRADGKFMEKNASYLLENGVHPYVLTEAECQINEFLVHLRNFIKKL